MINLDDLNPSQKEAVESIDSSVLILAGAGSGKTKTITTRLAYMISLGIDPANTLTLTFTNKSAAEMRQRAMSLLDGVVSFPPLLCTFHKFGLMFLRFNIQLLQKDGHQIYSNSFIITDSDDTKSILKGIDKSFNVYTLMNAISSYKNQAMSTDQAIKYAKNDNEKKLANIYKKYQEYLEINNMVDFDDLLFLSYKILNENEEVCIALSQKYQYIMVDEYQDTNDIQYLLLKKLCFTHSNICVVGDDDQSIYGWRGANIDNILNFEDEFENVKRVKLEENYRSVQNILDCANNLIKNNTSRLGKNLKSTKDKGDEVSIQRYDDEKLEALHVVSDIQRLIKSGENLNNIAILFRVNALSRVLESELSKFKIPFKLVGGVRFYERAEIKDIIAYFRLLVNGDDFSFSRVINKPKRGIGKVTLEKLQNFSIENSVSMYDALKLPSLSGIFSTKVLNNFKKFVEDIESLKDVLDTPMKFIYEFESIIGIKPFYSKTPDEVDRITNIDEFYALFKEFIKTNPTLSLEEFLNDLSLQSDQDQVQGDETIFMMSVHASKGLEFEHVFIVGFEDGFFPLLSPDIDIEEERRLAYVAITRAKQNLYISSVKSRFYRGSRSSLSKSCFITEIEKTKKTDNGKNFYSVSDLVTHSVFGMGKVEEILPSSNSLQKLRINFGGIRRDILSSFVKPSVNNS
jgi:DNA helicase-2/ATP-dependent DNA helicase PcrA